MKKKINITIVCDTEQDDEYIKRVMKRGVYRGLDTSPYYISAPSEVDSIDIDVETIPEQKDFQI